MAESFTNFFNNNKSFGLNIKVPEKTIQQVGKTFSNNANGVLEPLFTYLQENETVFNGDVQQELNKTFSQNFNLNVALEMAEEKVKGPKPRFDSLF